MLQFCIISYLEGTIELLIVLNIYMWDILIFIISFQ
jgi:hypothetical protein